MICLFDIDGTLLPSTIERIDLRATVAETIGRSVPEKGARSMSGKTDRRIVAELMEEAGLVRGPAFDPQVEEALTRIDERTETFLAARALPTLAGVVVLLETLRARDVTCGLLTGNTPRRARAKMKASGLERFFRFGAYGDTSEDRRDLVPVALAEAAGAIGRAPERRAVLLIGDAPGDLEAARAAGIACLLVATGLHTHAELARLRPDLLLDGFSAGEPALDLIERLERSG